MFKFFPAVLFSLVLCLPVTTFANLDQPLQALDDHALSARSIPFYCTRPRESGSS